MSFLYFLVLIFYSFSFASILFEEITSNKCPVLNYEQGDIVHDCMILGFFNFHLDDEYLR